MFRDNLQYKVRLHRVQKAVRGIGVAGPFHDFKAEHLTSKIKIEGLEELMLATWAMMQHIMTYLKTIDCKYEGGHKIGHLHIAIENLMQFLEPRHTNEHYVTLEVEAMEHVSRAAYAWMKSFRMLKNQKMPEGDGLTDWPIWS